CGVTHHRRSACASSAACRRIRGNAFTTSPTSAWRWEGAFALPDPSQRASAPAARVASIGWVIAALAIVAAVAIVAYSPRTIPDQPETRLEIVTPSADDPLSL